MKLIFSVLLLGSLTSAVAQEIDAASMMGFSLKKDLDLESTTYQYRSETQFKFSQKKFQQASEARAFCQARGMQLISDVDLLTLAIAGAGQVQAIDSAISFKVEAKGAKLSGIVAWNSENGKELTAMIDGQGSDSQGVSLEEFSGLLKQGGQSFAGLPAICQRSIGEPGRVVDGDRQSGGKEDANPVAPGPQSSSATNQ